MSRTLIHWLGGATALSLVALGASQPSMSDDTLIGLSLPSLHAQLAPEQAGKIVAFPAEDGDSVRRGEVLFELNTRLEELEVSRLRALADSDLIERRAKAQLDQQRDRTSRTEDLANKDITSERELQTQQYELELAELQLEQAKLDRMQAHNALTQAEELLSQRTVRSPFAGVVTRRFRNVGDAVERFAPVIEVMSLDPLWIEFDCPVTAQQQFRKGTTIYVAPAVEPDSWRRAKILFASLNASASSHTFLVRAAVDNPKLDWKAGLKMVIRSTHERKGR